jgi:hypothetical protein
VHLARDERLHDAVVQLARDARPLLSGHTRAQAMDQEDVVGRRADLVREPLREADGAAAIVQHRVEKVRPPGPLVAERHRHAQQRTARILFDE